MPPDWGPSAPGSLVARLPMRVTGVARSRIIPVATLRPVDWEMAITQTIGPAATSMVSSGTATVMDMGTTGGVSRATGVGPERYSGPMRIMTSISMPSGGSATTTHSGITATTTSTPACFRPMAMTIWPAIRRPTAPSAGRQFVGVVGNGNDIRVVRRGDTGQTSGSGPAPQQMVQLCGDDSKEVAGWPIERIQQLVMPTGEQQTALDELATASIKAAEMIKTACPAAPTFTAPGRLEAMEAQIEAMQHAIEIVREPMDRFYGLLTDEQKARLVAGQPAANQPPAGGGSLSQNCAAAKSATQWPAAQIERAVRPTGDQLAKLDALKGAAERAAGQLASCPAEPALTPPARLAAMSERLAVMLQSVRDVHAALAAFYETLNDEQKAQFNGLGRTLAARQS